MADSDECLRKNIKVALRYLACITTTKNSASQSPVFAIFSQKEQRFLKSSVHNFFLKVSDTTSESALSATAVK